MSSWIVATLRALPSSDYEYSRDDGHDPWDATADLMAYADDDGRVRYATAGNGCVYAYLETKDVDTAEEWIQGYAHMVDDAVLLEANDTTDTGTARYYPTVAPSSVWASDRYAETQGEDGTPVGQVALATMAARHGIIAADPFHDQIGRLDDRYLEDGQVVSE